MPAPEQHALSLFEDLLVKPDRAAGHRVPAEFTDRALPPGLATTDDVGTGARVMAVYTALTRLDWALARVADGEGALAGKFRHPSVAPYIRAMQRQVDQIEALLG